LELDLGGSPGEEESARYHGKGQLMKRTAVLLAAAAAACCAGDAVTDKAGADDEASPIFGVKLPAGYRDWRLISVAHEEGGLNDLRAILGNDVAVTAGRKATLPYPDGAVIARLAWSYDPLEESKKAFGRLQSYVAGPPKNGVQFMVKDSRKYASTGGWGFAQFDDGKPAPEKVQMTCIFCHSIVKDRDFVFNRYSP
jgi:Cytochrome P460